MSKITSPLYYGSTNRVLLQEAFWSSAYERTGPAGKFWIDIQKLFGNNWLLPRAGEWTMPWMAAVVPGFEMPKYDPKFNLSFSDVSDRRALDIRRLLAETEAPVALYYSGGIDSTICLCALIKNLSPDELRRIHLCLNAASIIENPHFFDRYIKGKFTLIDSSKSRYGDLVDRGYYAITGDQGDALFGTELGLQTYCRFADVLQRWPDDAHFSKFTDQILFQLKVDGNLDFARLFYEKLLHNIQTSGVPVHSLHDFYWWIIFNLKYMHCALRSSLFYFGGTDRRRSINQTVINWFNHPDYQRWSMCNNNNGEKIRGFSPTTYKWAGRKYIYDLDRNSWYLNHKLKIISLAGIIRRNAGRLENLTLFGMNKDYELLRITDPEVREFIMQSLDQYL